MRVNRGNIGWLLLAFGLMGCASPDPVSRVADLVDPASLAEGAPPEAAAVNAGASLANPDQHRQAAIDAYTAYLQTGPEPSAIEDAQVRADALQRVGDLRLQAVRQRMLGEDGPSEPAANAESRELAAIAAVYEQLLREHPSTERDPAVLYQLAQVYELQGEGEASFAVLDRVVSEYGPADAHPEVQFRRAERFYATGDYSAAYSAYGSLVALGDTTPYWHQAQYKIAWTRYRQNRHADALDEFLALLALQPAGQLKKESAATGRIEDALTMAARCADYLGGSAALDQRFGTEVAAHEPLVYARLAEHHLANSRYADAVAAWDGFIRRHPLHRAAPGFLMNQAHAFDSAGFAPEALAIRRRFVAEYGLDQPFWRHHDRAEHLDTLAVVEKQLDVLARHFHARAQQDKDSASYATAAGYYRQRVVQFAGQLATIPSHFGLADLLLETQDYTGAGEAYTQIAYGYPPHARSAEAGYAALLANQAHLQSLADPQAKAQWQRAEMYPAMRRFAEQFADHPKVPAVLAQLSERAFELGEQTLALWAATRLVNQYPQADPVLLQSGWTRLGYLAFDTGDYPRAEHAFASALHQLAVDDIARQPLLDQLGLSVYRQAEALIAGGDPSAAGSEFLRAVALAPGSGIEPQARYDAAAAYIQANDWLRAIPVLQEYLSRFAQHELAVEAQHKLAVGWMETGHPLRAARQWQSLAEVHPRPQVRREAAWQAAELFQQGGANGLAVSAWSDYVQRHPTPVADLIEARAQLLELYEAAGDAAAVRAQRRAIIQADRNAASERSRRTQLLAAQAALGLAVEQQANFDAIRLSAPFERSLARKQVAMRATLDGFEAAIRYAIASVTSEATYRSAEVYAGFASAMMDSERPSQLDADALEEYELLLEEQAYPFEERAIAIHTRNTEYTRDGLYDDWVAASYRDLARMMPARYAKEERDVAVHASLR